jgi:nitric oxide reductase subunit C
MPNQNLSDEEIDHLIAFLDWVSCIDNQGWPPRPILVAGTSIPGTDTTRSSTTAPASSDPVAKGEALFRSTPPGCSACHSIAAGVNLAGPTLANIGNRAAQVVGNPDYKGQAQDAAGYVRESIINPSASLVPGQMYSANGQSLMPSNYGKDLTPDQIDSLVAYLVTLK